MRVAIEQEGKALAVRLTPENEIENLVLATFEKRVVNGVLVKMSSVPISPVDRNWSAYTLEIDA